MPPLRFHPLLVAGAACLALAACGSDDDPPQANAPAQTAPTQTAPTQAPTTTAPDADPNRSTDPAETATGSDTPSDAATPSTDGASDSSSNRSSRPSGGKDAADSNDKRGGASDGDAGSAATEAVKIRESLVALQEAFAVKDGAKACSYMIGVPQKSDPKNPGMSCESLSQGPKGTLSEQNRTVAATAKVKINGDEATAELGPGVPMKLRKIDGRWRVDYSQMLGAPAGQG